MKQKKFKNYIFLFYLINKLNNFKIFLIYSPLIIWIASPSFILFSLIFLNLKIALPPLIRVLFVSLNSSYSLYNFSSTSATVFVFKHLIGWLFIAWSVDINLTTIISSNLK